MSRPDRVGELIKQEISTIIREDVNDPRIGFISITSVKVSPDLDSARILVSILGTDEEKKNTMQGLKSATPFIRGKLGSLLELRAVPELRFVRDDTLEKASQVLNIIKRLK